MKNPLKDFVKNFKTYFYNQNTLALAFILSMIFWFLGLRSLANSRLLNFLLVFGTCIVITCIFIDKALYYFDLWIETKFRRMLDDEGLILPRDFESQRLSFRQLSIGDDRLLIKMSRSKGVQNFVDDIGSNFTKAQARKWLVDHMNLERTSLRCSRVIVEKSSGASIGGLVIINGHEVEYWIHDAYHGNRYGLEAVKAGLEMIEKEDNIVLFAQCYKNNVHSEKLLKEVGFVKQEEGDTKNTWVYTNK